MLKAIIIKNLEKLDDSLNEHLVLIPKPKEIKNIEKNKSYVLTAESTFHYLNLDNQNILLNDLNEFLNQISDIIIKNLVPEDSDYELLKNQNESSLLNANNEESYNLEIKDGRIFIYSINEKGLFYGIQTLIQLIKNAFLLDKKLINLPKNERKRFILSEIEIKDVPDLKIRGIAQDISRGQVFTVENAKRYIKIISHYKMNFYCPYIEDMFAHPKHPVIGNNRGALTCDEIKEIDEFAKKRYVEFVPIFECLGHVDNILQHKEYGDLGEFPGAHSLDISNPKIYDFLNDYISELSKCFSTNYFHIGCDESYDIGRYNSKEYIKEKGKSEALVDFYEKVYQIVRENNNKYVIMYDDIVRKNEIILKNLNKDIILMYWDYSPKKSYPVVETFLKAGYKVIVSPSMLSWQRNFPDNKNASRNIINLIKTAYENRNNGCLGVLTSTWGDMRYYSLRENEIFGAILNGAVAWTTMNFTYKTFENDYGFLFYGIEKEYLNKFSRMFKILSKSANTYYKISVLIPPLFYTYFFKHPFYVKDYKPTFDKYKKLGDLADNCLLIYNDIKSKVLFELENFEYIEFGAELAKYLAEKIDISLNVSNILNKSTVSEEDIKIVASKLNYIKDKIQYIKEKYEILWLRAAKRPCLDYILNLFDFLIEKYNEKLAQINNKIYFEDPYIKSEWIWTSNINNPINPHYFRKIFEINQPIEKAIIQGIACNHMKIYINNEFVGDVLSRYSMSILPIVLRVKTFDITKNLKQGKNIIAIEAYNYDAYKGAINLYGQILLKDGDIKEIISDKTWVSKTNMNTEISNWFELDYNDAEWKEAKSYGRPPNLNGDIFKPKLLNGERSNTQDYFGIEGYMSNLTEETDIMKPEHMIKIFNPYGN